MLAVLLAALESDTDRQKFIEIYEKYHVQMERTAMRILKEQSDVEDAVQNAFMQMIRHYGIIQNFHIRKMIWYFQQIMFSN